MSFQGSKYINRKGEHVIILNQEGTGAGDKHQRFIVANLDRSAAQIDYNANSIGIPLTNLTQSDWIISSKAVRPLPLKYKLGIFPGVQGVAGEFAKIYRSVYLEKHGFTAVDVYDHISSADGVLHRYALKIDKGDSPFVCVRVDDVVQYMGNSVWKFVKRVTNRKEEKNITEAKNEGNKKE